jgi:transposase-like protein
MKKRQRSYTAEFKRQAVERFELSENRLALAEELGVERAMLYRWQKQMGAGGVKGLRPSGRPRGSKKAKPERLAEGRDFASAGQRIAELERLVGQQRLELDFFRGALQRVEEFRRASSAPGGTASTRRSKR